MNKKVNEHGTKCRQREDTEDRLIDYRNWKYKQKSLWTTDIDQVEWGSENGEDVPVAILEVTRIDDYRVPPDSYFEKIINRMFVLDTQGRKAVKLANRLNVPAFIVAYLQSMTKFIMYDMKKRDGWKILNENEYIDWHYKIRNMERPIEQLKQKPEIKEDPFADLI